MSRGLDAGAAQHAALGSMAMRVGRQATVLAFEKVFLLQVFAFIVVLPLLFFLRVERSDAPAHVELSME